MTRVPDRAAAERLAPVPDAIHAAGGRVVAQLDHGGLRALSAWHAGYRASLDAPPEHLVASRPPRALRAADAAGFLDLRPRVLATGAVSDLADAFAEAAAGLVAAGYDGIHLGGANAGLIQQFLSPYYNRRADEFGGSPAARARFLLLLGERIRERIGPDVPLLTKVPAETEAPAFVRPGSRIGLEEAVRLAERAAAGPFDALVPVRDSTFWDASLIRGAYPERAWHDERFRAGYRDAFGGRLRARAVALAHRLHARGHGFEPAWNADLCRRVRARVDVPVLCEGGLRERDRMDRLLGDACDAVGVGRPFYAEPRLPARLLSEDDAGAVCENCNNCVVPQAAGESGVCRTPSVLARHGELARQGAYDRSDGDGNAEGD
jgi:2,4-dienoyl-CoA reductase-like NADH-dependent reductase (Old Yellow Enzyme family)